MLALSQTQKVVSKLAIRALNDHYLESPVTEIQQMCHSFEKALGCELEHLQLTSMFVDEDLRYHPLSLPEEG